MFLLVVIGELFRVLAAKIRPFVGKRKEMSDSFCRLAEVARQWESFVIITPTLTFSLLHHLLHIHFGHVV